MDSSLWNFLLHSPEGSVPFPWERCLDLQTGYLYYKNLVEGSVVVDLRSSVDLGGGLYYDNTLWRELTRLSFGYPWVIQLNIYRVATSTPSLALAACQGCLTYIILPETALQCPHCGHSLFFF